MNKITETLIIIDHLGRIIKSRTDFCKRHISYNPGNCIQKKFEEYRAKGYEYKDFSEGEIAERISRECADIPITLHNYTRLNIIDMFSFNDEYNKYFNEKHFENLEIKNRIRKVKEKNKPIRKKLDWDQLRRFRNVVMAHNLRDRNNSNKLAFSVLKEINELVMNHRIGVEYADVVLEIFGNIKEEFNQEIKIANQEFIEKAKSMV